MIESLRLKHFQCHEFLKIEFDPLVTTIVGRSDVGKSSVLRALRWVSLNQPVGIDYRQHDKEDVSVLLKVDGKKIIRRRSDSENLYVLEGQEYKAFGQGVPDPISRLLNLDEINFQQQLSAPLWFLETAGQVSRELNAFVNLSAIDDALSLIVSQVKRAKSTLDVTQERYEQAEKEQEKYQYVEKIDKELQELEEQENTIAENVLRCSQLSDLLQQAKSLTVTIDRSSACISEGLDVIAVGEALQRITEQEDSLRFLLTECKQAISTAEQELPDLTELSREWEALDNHNRRMDELSTLLREANQQESLRCRARDELAEIEKVIALEFGKTCPVCGK